MVHGNPTWSFFYRRLVDGLAHSHRIVPDHIGCGCPTSPTTRAMTTRWRAGSTTWKLLLDQLGIDRDITLVLHDWGGMIGMAYAARHPERIARLVVSNTGGLSHAVDQEAALGPGALPRYADGLVAGPRSERFRSGHGPDRLHRGKCSPGLSCRLRGSLRFLGAPDRHPAIRPRHSPATRRSFLRPRVLGRDPSRGAVAVPILIGWGMKDFVFDQPFLDEWIRALPCRDPSLRAAGHYLLEDEHEAMIALIEGFLQSHPVTPMNSYAVLIPAFGGGQDRLEPLSEGTPLLATDRPDNLETSVRGNTSRTWTGSRFPGSIPSFKGDPHANSTVDGGRIGPSALVRGMVSAIGFDDPGRRSGKGAAALGTIERIDPRLDQIVPRDAHVERIAEGFDWSEGPVWDRTAGYLLFSDVPAEHGLPLEGGPGRQRLPQAERLHRTHPSGSEPGSNGLVTRPRRPARPLPARRPSRRPARGRSVRHAGRPLPGQAVQQSQ